MARTNAVDRRQCVCCCRVEGWEVASQATREPFDRSQESTHNQLSSHDDPLPRATLYCQSHHSKQLRVHRTLYSRSSLVVVSGAQEYRGGAGHVLVRSLASPFSQVLFTLALGEDDRAEHERVIVWEVARVWQVPNLPKRRHAHEGRAAGPVSVGSDLEQTNERNISTAHQRGPGASSQARTISAMLLCPSSA